MTIIIIRVLFSHRRIRAKDVGYPLHWCTWIHTAFKLKEENEPLVGLSNGYIETNSKMINVLHLNAMFEYSFLWFTYISLPRTLIQGRIGWLNTTMHTRYSRILCVEHLAQRKHIRDAADTETNCNKYTYIYSGYLIYYLRHWGRYRVSVAVVVVAVVPSVIAVIPIKNTAMTRRCTGDCSASSVVLVIN